MKNKIIKLSVATAFAVAFTQAVHATPITGTINFSGEADANISDAGSANSSSEVVSWGANTVGLATGSFVGLVTAGDSVALASPWLFDSGALANFWSVDGFTFNLASSSIAGVVSGSSVTVALAGTVTGHGFDATAFSGFFTLQNPSSSNGDTWSYSESLSFNSVPDGGTTILLLGAALSGLALVKRKFVS